MAKWQAKRNIVKREAQRVEPEKQISRDPPYPPLYPSSASQPKELRNSMDALLVDSLYPDVSAASGSPKHPCPMWPFASATATRMAYR